MSKSNMIKKLIFITVSVATIASHATVRYVNWDSPVENGDGLGWDTAMKTIQTAINVAVDWELVVAPNKNQILHWLFKSQ